MICKMSIELAYTMLAHNYTMLALMYGYMIVYRNKCSSDQQVQVYIQS